MNKRWCFTFNNPAEWRPQWKPTDMDYLVWQVERGEDGTVHVQGYVRFKNRKRMTTVKKLMDCDGMHLEFAKGTEADNKAYCTKEDTRAEIGEERGSFDAEAGKQGKRSDLEEVSQRIVAGEPMRDIALAHPGDFIRYHRGFEAFANVIRAAPAKERNVEVIVLWGPTGTGKTHRVLHTYPDCFCVEPGRDPWDGYAGEATIFLDEFDYTLWPINQMKKILDKWKYRLQRRYLNAYAEWTRVVICANPSPVCFYDGASAPDLDAFRRRIQGRCRLVESREQTLAELMEMPPNPNL